MESTSVVTASNTPIPSNPQVPILSFPHHSMLLLSNHTSEAEAITSNPHPLVSSLPNESPWCSWTTEHSVNQPPTPSPFQTSKVPLNPFPVRPQITRGVWRVEARNLRVSFSRNASGSLINIVHGSTDRVVGELRTLTSHAGLLPHHSSGEEDSDGSTARSRFIRKIVGIHVQRYLRSGILTETVGDEDGIGGGLEKGWHGMVWEGWLGRVSTMIHEIEQ